MTEKRRHFEMTAKIYRLSVCYSWMVGFHCWLFSCIIYYQSILLVHALHHSIIGRALFRRSIHVPFSALHSKNVKWDKCLKCVCYACAWVSECYSAFCCSHSTMLMLSDYIMIILSFQYMHSLSIQVICDALHLNDCEFSVCAYARDADYSTYHLWW